MCLSKIKYTIDLVGPLCFVRRSDIFILLCLKFCYPFSFFSWCAMPSVFKAVYISIIVME